MYFWGHDREARAGVFHVSAHRSHVSTLQLLTKGTSAGRPLGWLWRDTRVHEVTAVYLS